jgi:DNA polymerase epsilon subunit 3
MTKAATVFISYLSHTANDLTVKKTIGPNDVLAAIKETEFEAFLPRLERELEAYATVVAGKRKGYRMKVKERESVGAEGSKEGEDGPNGIDGEEDAERGAKRQRMDGERSGDDFEDASHLLNGASGSDTLGHDGPRHSGYDGAGEGGEGDTLEDEAALDQELDEADGDVGDETQDEEEDLGEEDQDDVNDGYGPGAQLRAAMEGVDDGLDDTGEESD